MAEASAIWHASLAVGVPLRVAEALSREGASDRAPGLGAVEKRLSADASLLAVRVEAEFRQILDEG